MVSSSNQRPRVLNSQVFTPPPPLQSSSSEHDNLSNNTSTPLNPSSPNHPSSTRFSRASPSPFPRPPSPHHSPSPGHLQQIPIPSAIPPIKPQLDSTPLPTLPIVVLCFAMISEFLSASVAGPFIFFMIEDFGVGAGEQGGGEAAVGFWAGIVSSSFFLTQFLTSILWSNISNTRGRRMVLFTSLLGNAITLLLFGSSTSLGMAICARLGQGVFNGAIGVARGAVRDLTDSTNEGRAIAWIGLCWGMGGITGAIIGGLLEHPVENYPRLFGSSQFLRDYPYFLPCFLASCITCTGAMLSLFLGWDGGYRTGKIQLSDSTIKHLDLPNSSTAAAAPNPDPRDHSQAINLLPPSSRDSASLKNPLTLSTSSRDAPNASNSNVQPPRSFTPGSAYGYDRSARRTLNWRGPLHSVGSMRSASNTMQRRTSRAISLARSFGGETIYAPDYDDLDHGQPPPTLNFAQRLLLSNEDAVFGLHDVWLAAATSQEQDDEGSQVDAYEDHGWGDSTFEDSESRSEHDGFGYDDGTSEMSYLQYRGRAFLQHQLDQQSKTRMQSQSSVRPSIAEAAQGRTASMARQPRGSFSHASNFPSGSYRQSVQSRLPHSMRSTSIASSSRPTIFGNTGLSTPPPMGSLPFAINQSHRVVSLRDSSLRNPVGDGNVSPTRGAGGNLSVIPETGRIPTSDAVREGHEYAPQDVVGDKSVEVEKQGVFRQLPLAIIVHYSVVAMHCTTCDQLFMSFLVTPIKSGGLGLSAGHYAELIAAMCVAQIVFQFRFYPTVGPPRGSLSHLAMFRLGLCLYIPVYMLLPELRGLLRENQNGLVMVGMILLSSFRWLANVCAYTSIMVLINAQTPPHLIPLANGLAQSAVSAARFMGPVCGGMLWSFSITPSVDARPYPFNNALGFFVVACICLSGFLMSFRLK